MSSATMHYGAVRDHHVWYSGVFDDSFSPYGPSPASPLTSTRHGHHTYRFITTAKMTVRVATGGDAGRPTANADCPEVYWPVSRLCAAVSCVLIFLRKILKAIFLVDAHPTAIAAKFVGAITHTSSYSTGSAFGAEAREVNVIIFLSWRTIVHSYLTKPTLFLIPACTASNTDVVLGRKASLIKALDLRGIAIIEKNNGEPPQEGIRLHSGIVRRFGECVPEVAFVCPQVFGEPGAAAGHCTGSFAKTHVIYQSSPRALGSGRSRQSWCHLS
ncbi:hypothetical protein EDB92DRAFT_762049 [Lactarius akahatsu]|uniref:Uncharacterized protein n=1 Tax=Lactarius akahatsu TaxID=416441 RepID=A0AAD4QD71_9AGAM|nr:hypothetical protein EDB92DRAFT_762049 [Lactarius akahatsu]